MGLVATGHANTADLPGEDPGALQCLLDLDARCNLGCPRCPRTSRGTFLTPAVALSLAERVIEQVAALEPPQRAAVALYGGEPLLDLWPLLRCAEAIADACAERRLPLDMGLVTNGLLLDRATAKRLRQAGFTRALVTLGPSQAIHDRWRPLADGTPSYERLVANVAAAREHLPVLIRVESRTADEVVLLPALLRDLHRRGMHGHGDLDVVLQRPVTYAEQARLLLARHPAAPPLRVA